MGGGGGGEICIFLGTAQILLLLIVVFNNPNLTTAGWYAHFLSPWMGCWSIAVYHRHFSYVTSSSTISGDWHCGGHFLVWKQETMQWQSRTKPLKVWCYPLDHCASTTWAWLQFILPHGFIAGCKGVSSCLSLWHLVLQMLWTPKWN